MAISVTSRYCVNDRMMSSGRLAKKDDGFVRCDGGAVELGIMLEAGIDCAVQKVYVESEEEGSQYHQYVLQTYRRGNVRGGPWC